MSSVGPAVMSIPTSPTRRAFAAVTYWFPGPTILSTRGTDGVPYASALTACSSKDDELDQFIGPNYVVTVHGPINPLEAREIFIHKGLAAFELETRGAADVLLVSNDLVLAERAEIAARPEVQAELVKHLSYGVPAKAAYEKVRNPASRYAMTGVFVADFGSGDDWLQVGAIISGVIAWLVSSRLQSLVSGPILELEQTMRTVSVAERRLRSSGISRTSSSDRVIRPLVQRHMAAEASCVAAARLTRGAPTSSDRQSPASARRSRRHAGGTGSVRGSGRRRSQPPLLFRRGLSTAVRSLPARRCAASRLSPVQNSSSATDMRDTVLSMCPSAAARAA